MLRPAGRPSGRNIREKTDFVACGQVCLHAIHVKTAHLFYTPHTVMCGTQYTGDTQSRFNDDILHSLHINQPSSHFIIINAATILVFTIMSMCYDYLYVHMQYIYINSVVRSLYSIMLDFKHKNVMIIIAKKYAFTKILLVLV